MKRILLASAVAVLPVLAAVPPAFALPYGPANPTILLNLLTAINRAHQPLALRQPLPPQPMAQVPPLALNYGCMSSNGTRTYPDGTGGWMSSNGTRTYPDGTGGWMSSNGTRIYPDGTGGWITTR